MSGLFDVLSTARTGLTASRAGIQVVSNNVAQANTPGYARQRLITRAKVAGGMTGSMSTVGVEIMAVERVSSRFLENQLISQTQKLSYHQGSMTAAKQLEPLFQDLNGLGVSDQLTKLFNALESASVSPADNGLRLNVLNQAESLAQQIQTTWSGLNTLRNDLLNDMTGVADQVNSLLERIAKLNGQTANVSPEGATLGADATLLSDIDASLEELAELVPIQTYTDSNGNINISMDGRTLLQGTSHATLTVDKSAGGSVSITGIGGGTFTLDGSLSGGKLGGLLHMREDEIPALMDQVDRFAFDLANGFNAVHQAGTGLDALSGRNLFDVSATAAGAAASLRLSVDVDGQPDRLAFAQGAGSLPGDNTNAKALLALRDDETLVDGKTGMNYWLDLTTDVGDLIRQADNGEVLYTNTVLATSQMRESLSGVSVDDEMLDLMQYQRAFQAAGRVVQITDGLLDNVLALAKT